MEMIEYLALMEEYKPQISEFISECIDKGVYIEYKREIRNERINYSITIENYDREYDVKDSIIYKFINKLQELGFKDYEGDDYLEMNYKYERLSIIDEILKKKEGVDVRKLNKEHDDVIKFCKIFKDLLSSKNYFKDEEYVESIKLY